MRKWRSLFHNAGLMAEVHSETTQTDLQITPVLLERWFSTGGDEITAKVFQS